MAREVRADEEKLLARQAGTEVKGDGVCAGVRALVSVHVHVRVRVRACARVRVRGRVRLGLRT
eukprot:6198237-Pleurochrysis_carterae.AAC.2